MRTFKGRHIRTSSRMAQLYRVNHRGVAANVWFKPGAEVLDSSLQVPGFIQVGDDEAETIERAIAVRKDELDDERRLG